MSLFENSRWRRPPYWKIHKRAYLGQFLIDLHQIWCACRYGQYKCDQGSKRRIWANSWPIYTTFGVLIDMGNLSVISVKNSTFLKFKMAAAAILKNTQKSVSQPILYRFAPNLVCLQVGSIQVSSGVQNLTFWKFKMAAAAILENIQKGISRPILDRFAPNLVCWQGNTKVTRGPKQHFLEIQDGDGRHLGKYTKGHISASS